MEFDTIWQVDFYNSVIKIKCALSSEEEGLDILIGNLPLA